MKTHRLRTFFSSMLLLASCSLLLPQTSRAASTPFIGDISWVAFNFAPVGWALCDGQTLQIAQYTALFALIGTTYGGDGQTTFNLPDLRGRAPIHVAPGYTLGQQGGEESHVLTAAELPAHTHTVVADHREGNVASPLNAFPAKSSAGTPAFAATANTLMKADTASSAGGGQPYANMKPFVAMTCIIALEGVFPSRN